MAATIKLKKSSVGGNAPSAENLDYGELAINYADGKLYYKNSSNQIKNFIDSDAVVSTLSSLSVDDLSDALTNYTRYTIALGESSLSTWAGGSMDWGHTALGFETLKSFQYGIQNVAIGVNAARDLQFGSYNTVLGANALNGQASTSTGNTLLGAGAGNVYFIGSNGNFGDYNIGVGFNTLSGINTTGDRNIAIGNSSGSSVQGDYNIVIGDGAYNASISTGSNNILIGRNAEASSTTASNEFTIGADSGTNGEITRVRIPGMGFDTNSGSAGQVLKSGGPGVLYWDTDAGGLDSSAVNALISAANAAAGTIDSAAVSTIITNNVNSTFINNLTIDADTLGSQSGSYYLNYNNFTNTPTIPSSGVDFDPVGTDNSTNVTLSGPYDYLTLSGQQITLNQIDASTDITGLASVATTGAYGDLSGTPTIPTLGNDFVDSAQVANIIAATDFVDSADVAAIIAATDLVDSADVAAIIAATDLVDSADVAVIVTGYNYITGVSISDQTSSSSTFYPAFTSSSSGSITAANVSTTKMYFQPSTGTLSATELNTLSDQTLKTDITPLSNSIDILNQVNPVSFRWKETGDKAYGVIAQEIEQVLPELVRSNSEGIKSVAYSQLIALLVDTVKDQQKQIDELRNIINK